MIQLFRLCPYITLLGGLGKRCGVQRAQAGFGDITDCYQELAPLRCYEVGTGVVFGWFVSRAPGRGLCYWAEFIPLP